jgi:hypothetical protein
MKAHVEIQVEIEVHGILDTDTGEITFGHIELSDLSDPGEREYAMYCVDFTKENGFPDADNGWLGNAEIEKRWTTAPLDAADNFVLGRS